MKKIRFLCVILLLFTILPALASATYYVTRSGDILQKMTNKPLLKNVKMDLICNAMFVKVGMDKYYLVKKEENRYTRKSLLGCQDYSSTNIFDPLIVLNDDAILEKVTSDELRKANVRFVKYNSASGTLDLGHPKNDLSLDKIAFIDLDDMTFYSNNYAYVHMYLKPKSGEQFSNNSRYLKQVLIEIRTMSFTYADRLINKRGKYIIFR